MSNEQMKTRKAVLICACSGACPSMAKIDFWALSERVRLEFGDKIEFIALHPRLCEPDGERLMGRILSNDLVFLTPACAEKRQEKLLRDGFSKAGVPMDADHWIPIGMAQEDTETVFQKIKAALEAEASKSPEGGK
jgi:hypothetical protein